MAEKSRQRKRSSAIPLPPEPLPPPLLPTGSDVPLHDGRVWRIPYLTVGQIGPRGPARELFARVIEEVTQVPLTTAMMVGTFSDAFVALVHLALSQNYPVEKDCGTQTCRVCVACLLDLQCAPAVLEALGNMNGWIDFLTRLGFAPTQAIPTTISTAGRSPESSGANGITSSSSSRTTSDAAPA